MYFYLFENTLFENKIKIKMSHPNPALRLNIEYYNGVFPS